MGYWCLLLGDGGSSCTMIAQRRQRRRRRPEPGATTQQEAHIRPSELPRRCDGAEPPDSTRLLEGQGAASKWRRWPGCDAQSKSRGGYDITGLLPRLRGGGRIPSPARLPPASCTVNRKEQSLDRPLSHPLRSYLQRSASF